MYVIYGQALGPRDIKLVLHAQLDQRNNLDNVKSPGLDSEGLRTRKNELNGFSEFIPDLKIG